MEFGEVVRRRRMVRRYEDRPVPDEALKVIVRHALRAPSAGFVQGWGFLVLTAAADRARFREAVTPPENADRWLAANVVAPVIVVVHSNMDAYLDRHAQPDKGLERSEASWPAPYWDIDAGFAAMLMLLSAIDQGLGAAFFGLPGEQIDAYRDAFGVPASFKPIGAVSIGYAAEPASDISADRKRIADVLFAGSWGTPFAA
ncbi:MAG TPA: nitroreductase family protein [Solirubrobacteraceae bacterium]|nr:nitroreductase family protein [Solirubrobacteraceae bacterium]